MPYVIVRNSMPPMRAMVHLKSYSIDDGPEWTLDRSEALRVDDKEEAIEAILRRLPGIGAYPLFVDDGGLL